MAQYHFLGTSADSREILPLLDSRGDLWFIPAIWRSSADVRMYCRARGYIADFLRDGARAFLLPKQYGRRSLTPLRRDWRPKRARYTLHEGESGPCLSLQLAHGLEEAGILSLCLGTLSYPREYYDAQEGGWRKPPDSLKLIYHELVKTIKSVLVRHRVRHEIWIGREALNELNAGRARIAAHV